MFYQNSNDLVKNASVSSGHVQNSNDTRGMLIRNTTIPDFGNNNVSNNTHTMSTFKGLTIYMWVWNNSSSSNIYCHET